MFWREAGRMTWDGATRVLSRSLSLIINVWLPNPILSKRVWFKGGMVRFLTASGNGSHMGPIGDRKSTRLNSSHQIISYAVFCLKKKKHEPNQSTDVTGLLLQMHNRIDL